MRQLPFCPLPVVSGLLQELWKAGQFDRLDLQPSPPDETTTLLSATLGGSMDSHAAGRLWELARGNVLYLHHIVEQEVADGRLKKLHGYWQRIGDPIMPCGLMELIESRIGALPATSTAASKSVWRTRSTARCAGNARHPPGCVGSADWSPPNWPLGTTATTSKSSSAAPH
jgi:hypothetical protein